MQCSKCGNNIENASFCPFCGNPLNNNIKNTNTNIGTITVTRIKQFKGALIPFHVYIDNIYIGDVKSDTVLNYNVYYGHHVVVFKSTEKDLVQEVDINENYRNINITCEARFGLLAAKPYISNINVY